jgi:hypothetical protein
VLITPQRKHILYIQSHKDNSALVVCALLPIHTFSMAVSKAAMWHMDGIPIAWAETTCQAPCLVDPPKILEITIVDDNPHRRLVDGPREQLIQRTDECKFKHE